MKFAGYELSQEQEHYIKWARASTKEAGPLATLVSNILSLVVLLGFSWAVWANGPTWILNLTIFYYYFTYVLGICLLGYVNGYVNTPQFIGATADRFLFNELNNNLLSRGFQNLYGNVMSIGSIVILASAGQYLLASVGGLLYVMSLFWKNTLLALIRRRLDEIQYVYQTQKIPMLYLPGQDKSATNT